MKNAENANFIADNEVRTGEVSDVGVTGSNLAKIVKIENARISD